MKNKRKNENINNRPLMIFIISVVVFIIATMFPITAFAFVPPEAEQAQGAEPAAAPKVAPAKTPGASPTSTPTSTQMPAPTPTPEPYTLTPVGNMTLVDDISGAQAQDKQFITVVTKSGKYFYIVIDRSNNNENVYFLNLVDESDLMALMDNKDAAPETLPASAQSPGVTLSPSPSPAVTSTPSSGTDKKQNNTKGILILIVLVVALGVGALFYFKFLKPKRSVAGNTNVSELDDFDFDDDETDALIGEPEPEETEEPEESEESDESQEPDELDPANGAETEDDQ